MKVKTTIVDTTLPIGADYQRIEGLDLPVLARHTLIALQPYFAARRVMDVWLIIGAGTGEILEQTVFVGVKVETP